MRQEDASPSLTFMLKLSF